MTSRSYMGATPLVLPRAMPGGKTTKKHPLLWLIDQHPDEPKSQLAHHMGVRPQTLFKWLAHCREDRNFSLPLERAIQIARYYDVPVGLLRPDAATISEEAAA